MLRWRDKEAKLRFYPFHSISLITLTHASSAKIFFSAHVGGLVGDEQSCSGARLFVEHTQKRPTNFRKGKKRMLQ
jgi:hypothetical protein